MNLLARLLLETRTDFRFFLNFSVDSISVFLKQPGTLASMDGVNLGSNRIDRVSSSGTCKSVRRLVRLLCL